MSRTIPLVACAILAAMLSAPCSAAAETPVPMEQALILRVDGQLTIDALGVPTEYQIKTTLPQKLGDNLQRAVRTWRFEPVLIGGKPVVAHTQMRVTLAAQGSGDAYRIAVDNVTFPQIQGEATDTADDPVTIAYARRPTIVYPHAALAAEIDADTLVYLHLSQEGRVKQVFVTQVALLNVRGKPADLRSATDVFERQVLSDVKDWRFRVDVDQVKLAALQSSDPDAVAMAFTLRVPIHFRIEGSRIDDHTGWLQEARTPLRHAPWLPPDHDSVSVGVADVGADELAPASEGRFRLSVPVAGTAL